MDDLFFKRWFLTHLFSIMAVWIGDKILLQYMYNMKKKSPESVLTEL